MRAGLSWQNQEVLLGHKLSYHRPTMEHLEEVYSRAVPFITVSEAEDVKQLRVKDNEDHERGIGRVWSWS